MKTRLQEDFASAVSKLKPKAGVSITTPEPKDTVAQGTIWIGTVHIEPHAPGHAQMTTGTPVYGAKDWFGIQIDPNSVPGYKGGEDDQFHVDIRTEWNKEFQRGVFAYYEGYNWAHGGVWAVWVYFVGMRKSVVMKAANDTVAHFDAMDSKKLEDLIRNEHIGSYLRNNVSDWSDARTA